jgi:hypothetical protein
LGVTSNLMLPVESRLGVPSFTVESGVMVHVVWATAAEENPAIRIASKNHMKTQPFPMLVCPSVGGTRYLDCHKGTTKKFAHVFSLRPTDYLLTVDRIGAYGNVTWRRLTTTRLYWIARVDDVVVDAVSSTAVSNNPNRGA